MMKGTCRSGLVLALTLAILIPLMMIRGTIQERQQYRDEAVRKVGLDAPATF